jgi:hypothetical protein
MHFYYSLLLREREYFIVKKNNNLNLLSIIEEKPENLPKLHILPIKP